jgi:hypothetical protein
LLFACAKPNYQNISSNLTGGPYADLSDCALILQKINQCVSLTWIQASTDSQMGVFNLDFSAAVTSEVKAVLWMPSMGHGSRPTTVTRLSESQFQVSNVAFIMPGEWEIRIQLKENNQVVDEVSYKIIY